MVTIGFVRLEGNREAPDKTIRYLLSTNWNQVNTDNKTPVFQSDTEEHDYMATDDMADENLVTVRWLLDKRIDNKNNEPNGDTVHHWMHVLAIDLWGESMYMAMLMQDEINRILWEFRPSNDTRLSKSDGNDSEADYFEKDEIDFERVQPEAKNDVRPSFGAILEIHYRKSRT